MCGGEGTRLADSLGTRAPEKPLYPIDGEPMVDWVLNALDASEIEQVYAAVSPATPDTRAHLRESVSIGQTPISILETPGEGYVTDLSAALDALDRPVLTVAADLPLLTGALVDDVLATHRAEASDGGSMTVAVPASHKERLGVSVDTVLDQDTESAELIDGRNDTETMPERIAPTGLNVVGDRTSSEMMYLTANDRLAVNVNRARDAQVVEALR